MVRLRKQARHCNFGATLEENLRDQLIEKLPAVELKKKLLEVNNITREAAIDKIRKWEASREQASKMVTPIQEPRADTNAVEESPGRGTKGKCVCFISGKEGHFARSKNCPARGRKCRECDKYGHYASCCKGGRNPKSGKQAPPNNGEADSSVMVMGDRPIKTRIIVAKKVRMTHLLLL